MHFWDRHKTITGYYESLTSTICDKYDLTQMEYNILMFLHGNPEFNTAADKKQRRYRQCLDLRRKVQKACIRIKERIAK